MARGKAPNAVTIEGINDEDDDRRINKAEDQDSVGPQPRRSAMRIYDVHRKDQRFSRRSVNNSKDIVIRRMQTEIAAPSGQSYAAPKRLCTMLAVIVAEGPPTSSGARKSPSDRTNAKVAPASSPGMERGRMMRRNVARRSAPRSCEASTSGRGICSSAAYMGRKTNGV